MAMLEGKNKQDEKNNGIEGEEEEKKGQGE